MTKPLKFTSPPSKDPEKFDHKALNLVLQGKGMMQKIEKVQCSPWLGSVAVTRPLYDEEQSELNRKLGYW